MKALLNIVFIIQLCYSMNLNLPEMMHCIKKTITCTLCITSCSQSSNDFQCTKIERKKVKIKEKYYEDLDFYTAT